jgi:hypothetical protein
VNPCRNGMPLARNGRPILTSSSLPRCDPAIPAYQVLGLRGFQGYWSRRINDEHRLIYKVYEDEIRIAQCRYHYQ